MIYKTYSCDETEKIAFDFALGLKGGEIITLDGDLGAGKTAFVRGLAKGLDISDAVVSPTFTIVNEYTHGKIPLFHFDVYRIESEDEMYDIGWEDYLNRGGVVVIEWAVNIEPLFKNENLTKIKITKDLNLCEDYRQIEIVPNMGGKTQ